MSDHHNAAALARAVWTAAEAEDMSHEDVIGCCALLISEVSRKLGEPVGYLLLEVKRRIPKGKVNE